MCGKSKPKFSYSKTDGLTHRFRFGMGDRISDAEMQQLNDRVDSQKQDMKQVVQAFRRKKSL
jgi:hypothetical protein